MAKKTVKKVVKRATVSKPYNPHESIIIQLGVVVIIVSAIAIFAYTYATYGMR